MAARRSALRSLAVAAVAIWLLCGTLELFVAPAPLLQAARASGSSSSTLAGSQVEVVPLNVAVQALPEPRPN
eukprot:CAMPEP_0171101206 /NCGR_PEP_ID=MMETSP0766_2-20121228/54253_1 /TAXON_ID=439317 /ORGANISM="Gambierdiscus australes, Strain CAWD 149" /LENGTH=71 /DNA_ID=CAMNT_0011561189 /DNA_START=79 /DNA_END=291 /DNA_ORIENTATION=+